jgi:hypothetical protein
MSRRWIPLTLAIAGCTSIERPARFADVAVIEDVLDDRPIAIPHPLNPLKEAIDSEAYVERPIVAALDPTRAPDAGDVNALDEVPRSTWFSPDVTEDGDAAEPPALPFRLLPLTEGQSAVTREGALAVMDARGVRFEMWRDPSDRPEMASGAAAAASRILRALGYFTPAVWATDVSMGNFVLHDDEEDTALTEFLRKGPLAEGLRYRVALTRWPVGVDLGPTPATGRRSDDPNDRVPHEDRRTLRALELVFGWLGMTEAGAAVFRDAYVGAPGSGHVVHYLAGLGSALGAGAVVRPLIERDDDHDLFSRNVWVTLGTLGLYHLEQRLTPEHWPSIGEYRETWSVADFHTGPPFAAMDRALPADVYWAAKRIAAARVATLTDALDAGHYHDDSARTLLGELLRARQSLAVRWGFAQVTPCEVVRLDQATLPSRATLVLRDEALSLGIADEAATWYRVEAVDETGRRVAADARFRISGGSLFPVRLPENPPPYVVLRVTAYRSGKALPRAMEVHLARKEKEKEETWRVVGVVH